LLDSQNINHFLLDRDINRRYWDRDRVLYLS